MPIAENVTMMQSKICPYTEHNCYGSVCAQWEWVDEKRLLGYCLEVATLKKQIGNLTYEELYGAVPEPMGRSVRTIIREMREANAPSGSEEAY